MRKVLSLSLLTIAAITAQAQTKINVRGTAPAQVRMVYVWNNSNFRGEPTDSSAVTDGKWTLEKDVPAEQIELAFYTERANPFDTQPIRADETAFTLVDATPVEIDLTRGTVKGSKGGEAMNTTMKGIIDIMTCDEPDGKMEFLRMVRRAMLDNTDSMLPAIFIGMVADGLSYRDLQTIVRPDAPYYNHPSTQRAKALIAKMAEQYGQLDKPFTDFAMPDTEGKERRLSEWCGKGGYVLVDFWASWCGPCRAEMPNVVANYEKYHGKGLEIIGVSFDNNKDAWLRAIKDLNMPWPQLSDLKGWKCLAAGIYNIRSIPSNLLIDGEGKIVDINLRGEILGERLAEIFK